MKHILAGYGYTASFVAERLVDSQVLIEAYARKTLLPKQPSIRFICRDIVHYGLAPQTQPFYLYYFIAPPDTGNTDPRLKQFIQQTDFTLCQGIVYIGSSAVYGDHGGAELNEDSHCIVNTDRQRRRLDAERQIQALGQTYQLPALLLRCAGIYGPNRLPIDNARLHKPLVKPSEAPLSNLIYVKDLANIIISLVANRHSGTYNIADGAPKPMGYLQRIVAERLGYSAAPELSYREIYQNAPQMKRFFMQSSKRLQVSKLLSALPEDFQFTDISTAVQQSLILQGDH